MNILKFNYDEFIGKKFGKIKIVEIYDNQLNGKSIKFAKCLCDCGNTIEKRFYDVKDGKITSCRMCDSILLIGKKFEDLTVIETFYKNNSLWCKCNCSCGNVVEVSASNLKRGYNKSCGKCDSNLLIGKTFGELTVLETFYKKEKNKTKLWCKCECSCGNTIDIRAQGLKSGQTQSCGTCYERVLIGKNFGELKVLNTFYKTNTNNKKELWCNCTCSCGKNTEVRARGLIRKDSPQISCGCIKISKGQKIIENWLTEHDILFTKEETFNKSEGLRTDKCNYLRFDIYIPIKNLIIEFDGIQHFYPIEIWGGEKALIKTKEHDLIKNNWAIQNKIDIVRFNYKQSRQQIENILNSLLL